MKKISMFLSGLFFFLLLTGAAGATILDNYPTLYATLNGNYNSTPKLLPGFGIVDENSGTVNETRRMTIQESQNSYSAFGITRNSMGEYWTSTANALVQFNQNTGQVIQSISRINEGFLNVVFDPFDRMYGWSNGNGFLYEIQVGGASYSEIPLFYIGLHAGGLTEMAFTQDGTLYGVDNRNKRLITIDLISGTVSTLVNLYHLNSISGLAVAPDDTLFLSDSVSRILVHFDRFGNELGRMGYTSSSPILGLEFASHPVPEPSTILLLGSGILGLAGLSRRKN